MEAADVERAAREAERLPGVEIQLHQGLPVAAEAPLGPARYIAEHLRVFGNAESEADFLNSGPKPAEVAEEVLAVRRAAEHAEGGLRRFCSVLLALRFSRDLSPETRIARLLGRRDRAEQAPGVPVG